MPAADLISAGEIDRFVVDFRTCRDRGLASNCTQYAEQQMQARHPQESRAAIISVSNHARTAIDYGNAANRANDTTIITGSPNTTPGETQRRGGQGGTLRYRYGVTVTITFSSGQRSGQTQTYRYYVTSREALSRAEIQADAEAQVQAFADKIERDYERPGVDLVTSATIRIESAYRDRA